MKLFIIIVTYNGKQWYDRCFGSLRSSNLPIQTIVVDNASSDDTVNFIKENYPEIILIESITNLGFGQANNKGIEYALRHDAEAVYLLNQDAWVEPNTFSELVRIHKLYPEFGILSPMHINATKTAIEKGLLNHIIKKTNVGELLLSDLFSGTTKDVYAISYVNAAGWLLPKSTLETVGGFDPIFFHYGEDDNYMQRVHFHGLKIGICIKSKMVHDRVINQYQSISLLQQQRLWLINLTDINKNIQINKIFIQGIKQFLISLIKGNITKLKYYWHYSLFIIKNKKKIILSRHNNINIEGTWLNIIK